jgi:hypothetical protein
MGDLMNRLLEIFRYEFARWRLRRALRPIERQIADARRNHKPVRHLIQAKRALVLYGLRGSR